MAVGATWSGSRGRPRRSARALPLIASAMRAKRRSGAPSRSAMVRANRRALDLQRREAEPLDGLGEHAGAACLRGREVLQLPTRERAEEPARPPSHARSAWRERRSPAAAPRATPRPWRCPGGGTPRRAAARRADRTGSNTGLLEPARGSLRCLLPRADAAARETPRGTRTGRGSRRPRAAVAPGRKPGLATRDSTPRRPRGAGGAPPAPAAGTRAARRGTGTRGGPARPPRAAPDRPRPRAPRRSPCGEAHGRAGTARNHAHGRIHQAGHGVDRGGLQRLVEPKGRKKPRSRRASMVLPLPGGPIISR